jgi:hypothetical protein
MQPIAQIKTDRQSSNLPSGNSFFEQRLTNSNQNIHKIIQQFKDQDENSHINRSGEIRI